MTNIKFQPMPDLTEDQLDALRADIEAHGVRVPVVKDQHGRILDGNNRAAIADELGIEYPIEVVQVADDDEAHDIAVSLNCARRHLTREQVRELIVTEHERRPDDSDRAIARRVGCSPSTVAAALRPSVSKLDTSAEAEARCAEIRDNLVATGNKMFELVAMLMSHGITAGEVVIELHRVKHRWAEDFGAVAPELRAVIAAVVDPVIGFAIDPATTEFFRPYHEAAHFRPFTDEDKADILASLGGAR